MLITRLLNFLVLIAPLTALTADLYIQQYEPLRFKLQFSQAVNQPAFQLLYNNVQNIPHTMLSNTTISKQFIFEGDISNIKVGSNIQLYSIMFNNPLSIGNGQLALKDYNVKAIKIPVTISFQPFLGIIIIVGVYFFNVFTETGTMLAQFVHVYVLYMFESEMSTTIYRQLYMGTLMLPPTNILLSEFYDPKMFVLLCLALPPGLLLFFGIIGIVVKKKAPKERSVFWNEVYQELVFSTFLRIANIYQFNYIYNGIKYLVMIREEVPFVQDIKGLGCTLVYFNFLTFVFLIYLKIYVLNPKKGQSDASFNTYLQSQNFKDFRLIHQKMYLDIWYRRNFAVIGTIKNGIIAIMFFWGPVFKYLMLGLQFMHIFAIFILMPFKEDFYRTIKIVCRLLFLFEYIFIVLSYLYYTMSPVVFNYNTVTKLMTAQVTLFCILIFAIFIIIFVEIYFKCSNLNYQIKLVKEANQYKLQIIQKENDEDNRQIKKTITSDKRSKSSSRTGVEDIFQLRQSNMRTGLLEDGQKKEKKRKNKKNIQIEMIEIGERVKSSLKEQTRGKLTQIIKTDKNIIQEKAPDKKQ